MDIYPSARDKDQKPSVTKISTFKNAPFHEYEE